MIFLTWLGEHWSSITTDTVTFVYAVEKAGGLRTICNKFMGPKQDTGVLSTTKKEQTNETVTAPVTSTVS